MAERDWLAVASLAGHLARVFTVTLTSNDTQIVSTGDDCTIRVWDLASGNPVGEPLSGHRDRICAVTVISGNTLAAADDDQGTARMWELTSGEPFGDPFKGV